MHGSVEIAKENLRRIEKYKAEALEGLDWAEKHGRLHSLCWWIAVLDEYCEQEAHYRGVVSRGCTVAKGLLICGDDDQSIDEGDFFV